MSVSSVTEKIYMIDAPFHGKTGLLSSYLIKSGKNAIMDPGTPSQIPGILEALDSLGIKELKRILLTHIHLDHGAGSWKLLEKYPEAKVHCHPRGVPHMVDPSKIIKVAEQAFGEKFSLYGKIRGLREGAVIPSSSEGVLEVGDVNLLVIWTPGHSTHSQTYFEPKNKIVFVGDLAGHMPYEDIVIPASPHPFNPEDTIQSIMKLIDLKPDIICYSHFGYKKKAVNRLKMFKEQVELWNNIVMDSVEKRLDPSEILSLLAEKDEKVNDLLERDTEGKSYVYQSLNGFYSYARWKMKREQIPQI